MKILLATSTINYNGGGISSYAVDIIMLLHKDYDFYIFSTDIIQDELKPFIKEHYSFNSTNYSLQNLRNFILLIEKIQPEIIINSNFRLLSIAIPYLKPEIIKISISHFVDGQLAFVAGYNHLYYDSIVALSYEGKKFIDKYFKIKDENKVKVIYNFYRANNNSNEYLLKKLNNKTLIITYPGGSSLNKNAILVYKLLKKLIKTDLAFKFYWLGNTFIPGARHLKAFHISDLFESDDRIEFTGYLDRKKATEKIFEANIFLLPSKKEGCPISLLEAISIGVIPIVADSKHASSELIKNNENGFVLDENDENQYVNLIKDIIENHSCYHHIYENSSVFHRDHLSGEKWEQSMKKIFVKQSYPIKNKNNTKLNILQNTLKFKKIIATARLKEIFKSLMAYIYFCTQRFAFLSKNKRKLFLKYFLIL